jgi:hypothetical protein
MKVDEPDADGQDKYWDEMALDEAEYEEAL